MTVHADPTTGLRHLLEGLFDYAGLFPPAKLDMGPTVRNYDAYLGGEEAWMLGRLIVPVARLNELEQEAAALLPTGPAAEAWQLSGLTAPAGDPKLAADLVRITAFNKTHRAAGSGRAAIQVIELRAETAADIDDAFRRIPEKIVPFFELPIDRDPRGLVAALAGSSAGAKVRTGGLDAAAFPTPERLARFIWTCATAGVPFKATAGLHHPMPHHAASVGAETHGFLNVLTAAALAHTKRLPEPELIEVLADESLDSFAFTAEGLSWRDHTLDLHEIDESRMKFFAAIGSCSIEEPRDDLRSLKLLE